nr:MAG TPA: baseplate assembly protein V [Caudoviricetes sp.]
MNSLAKLAQKTRQAAQTVSDGIRQAFRGRLALTQADTPTQRVQVQGLADETLQDLEQLQQFGFTSHAPAGTDVVVIPLGGDTSHGIVVAAEHGSYRIKNLRPGEVAVYDQSGSSIVLKNGRLIEVDCDTLHIKAATKVMMDSPLVEASKELVAQGRMSGNDGLAVRGGKGGAAVQINGGLETTEDVVAGGVSVMRHTHTEQGDGADVSAPH